MNVDFRNYDFLIAGAGILGLTIAHELSSRFPAAKIAILEKEPNIGRHASGRNSGVLHSGIYYPQDSLKATVCADGAKRMFDFALEHEIACHKVGKVIVATDEHEIPAIDFLLTNASKNKITAERLDTKQIREIEPYANGQTGIYTPDTARIDSKKILEKITSIIQSRGVAIHFQQKVTAVNLIKKQIHTNQESFSYGYFFNATGSGTDKIAKLFGLAKEYRLLPFKGIYFKLRPEKSYLVNSNIYPVPDLQLPFLGVHFSKNIFGEVYVGPTAIPAFGRENYGLIQGMNIEALRIFKDILLMYFANQQNFRKLIHSEIKKYQRKYFINCAKKLLRDVQLQDLISSNKVGIRPQLINLTKKKIEMDYIIQQEKNSMHILNAISPAFTSAFSFAKLLVNRM